MKPLLICLLFSIAVEPSVRAQEGSASIEGFVRDLSGKPITEATVYGYEVDNVHRRISTTTDSTGKFIFKRVAPGQYNLHAYKESDGYADTMFSFFANGNKKAWRPVTVQANQKIKDVNLTLGPKYAVLKISVRDEDGQPSGASLIFTRLDDPKRPYQRGGDLSGELTMLVPAVSFRVRVERAGSQPWNSEVIRPEPGGNVSISARLVTNR
ncbi:MAG TPA: carboxypeptidase-like regulatory domain-containing protein [Pyrinomonadaceae bacterium]|nr:carboxypeptidase-like regulatory domain-containing protein [Pyrinomonadaceae bacterium]